MSVSLSFQLRQYQIRVIKSVYEYWSRHRKRVMLQLPTGGGKTVIFGAIAKEFVSRNETVLILAHREELVIQALEKVTAIVGCQVGIIKAGRRMNLDAPIQVASVQSMVNRVLLQKLEAVL